MRSALVLFAVLIACERKSPPTAAPASDAATTSVMEASTPIPVEASTTTPASTFLAFQGNLGTSADFGLVLERSGDQLAGIASHGSDDIAVRGETKDGKHVSLTEIAPNGKKRATFEGELDGMRIVGTWKDPRGELKVTAGPAAGITGEAFEQAYLGSLGTNTRIRMKLKKAGTKVTGVYRYARSKDDLKLEGTIAADNGRFTFAESNAQGTVTGKFEGVFLRRELAFGRWTSPDGTRSFPVTLRHADVYPEPVALAGGGRLVPQEEYKEQRKFCEMSLQFPEVAGTGNKAAEKTLNAALHAEAGDPKKITCEGASEDFRSETDTTYRLAASRPGHFVVRYQFYQYSGGAHGMHAIACYAGDLTKGTLTKLEAKLLSADARAKVQSLANDALRKENGTTKLSTLGFTADEVKLSDATTLCVEGNDLVVQFQTYEVAPYAMGAPTAKIAAKDAAPLVANTPLAPFFATP